MVGDWRRISKQQCVGIGKLRSKVMRERSEILACVTPLAQAFRKTRSKPRSGIEWPLNRAMLERNTILESPATRAKAFLRIRPRQRSGFGPQLSKIMSLRNS